MRIPLEEIDQNRLFLGEKGASIKYFPIRGENRRV